MDVVALRELPVIAHPVTRKHAALRLVRAATTTSYVAIPTFAQKVDPGPGIEGGPWYICIWWQWCCSYVVTKLELDHNPWSWRSYYLALLGCMLWSVPVRSSL